MREVFGYKWIFFHNNEKSKEYSLLSSCTYRGMERIRGVGREYAISMDGGFTFGVRRDNVAETRVRVRELIRDNPNRRPIVRAYEGEQRVDQVKFVTLSTIPPVRDTEGVEGIDRIVGWIESEVRQGRLKDRSYAGICVCKTTSSGQHSDHADCAAIDIFGSNATMETIRDTVYAESDYFRMKYIILYNRIWFPNEGAKLYTGTYHDHVHISVYGGDYNAACR